METFWFFWLRFRRAYDSAYDSDYDSDFRFSLGHKLSYDSDSVANENQPLVSVLIEKMHQTLKTVFNHISCLD